MMISYQRRVRMRVRRQRRQLEPCGWALLPPGIFGVQFLRGLPDVEVMVDHKFGNVWWRKPS
jgi:hypothetical protein